MRDVAYEMIEAILAGVKGKEGRGPLEPGKGMKKRQTKME
jgi:hypothetical protein